MTNSRFRVWDKVNKKMMYQPLADLEDLYIGVIDGILYTDTFEAGMVRADDDRFQLMQSTGLYDCEGKEVFEGDIVALVINNPIPHIEKHEVIFSSGCFLGKRLDAATNIFCANYMYLHVLAKDGYTVIGSRFENPELLEGKE